MPFIGFNFEKLSAERYKEVKGDIKIKHNLNIVDVKDHKVSLDKKQEVLKFDFEFNLEYTPNIGKINIKGSMLYTENVKKLKEIKQEWEKSKKLPNEIFAGLFNTILAKSNIKALELSQEINLPPHLPLPRIDQQQKVKVNVNEYIG